MCATEKLENKKNKITTIISPKMRKKALSSILLTQRLSLNNILIILKDNLHKYLSK